MSLLIWQAMSRCEAPVDRPVAPQLIVLRSLGDGRHWRVTRLSPAYSTPRRPDPVWLGGSVDESHGAADATPLRT